MTHPFTASLLALSQAFATDCLRHQHRVAVAESCSGGLLAALLTHHSGASAFFTHGFVTYSNQAKSSVLSVPAALIQRYGAVSSQVACAMAYGAMHRSQATRSLSITGIAGPNGGSKTKPVGTVYIACQETQDDSAALAAPSVKRRSHQHPPRFHRCRPTFCYDSYRHITAIKLGSTFFERMHHPIGNMRKKRAEQMLKSHRRQLKPNLKKHTTTTRYRRKTPLIRQKRKRPIMRYHFDAPHSVIRIARIKPVF